jgi:hypothetical protein
VPKKKNNAHRRRQRQMTVRNPVKSGAYEQVWFDERGNPVAAGAYDEVWSDLTGAKPKKRGRRRRTTQPTATVQPIAGGGVVSVEPLESLSDAELKAKYKSVFPGRGRCPAPATMIERLQAKGETAAAVVEPPKTKRRVKKPKTVKAKDVAPDVPSAPKREYAQIRKVSEIDALQGPFTIDADATEQGSRKIYFFDGKGKAYVYSAKNDTAKASALKRLAVAEISGDKPTAKDAAAIDALDKQLDKTTPVKGDLVVVAPETKKPKRRTGAKKPPAAKKPPTRRRKKTPAKEPSLEEMMMAEIGGGSTAAAAAEPSLEEMLLGEIASNPRRNRRNARSRRGMRRRRNGSLSAGELRALKKLILSKIPVSDAKADRLVAIIDTKTDSAEFSGMTTNKAKLKYILAVIDSIAAKLGAAADAPAEGPMAPSAEDIVALVQNVAVSGAHDEARRAVDNADKDTIKKAWRLLTGSKRGRTPSEANMRKAVLAYLDTKDEEPGVMTETGEPTEAGGVDMPSDAEARKEIERRIKAKVAEMTGAPAPRKPPTGRKKPPSGGKKTPSGRKKTPKVSAEELAANVDIDDILGNPRRRRPARRKTTRRNRF